MNQQRVVSGFHAFGTKVEFLPIEENFDYGRALQLALNQRLRQGIFYILLQSTPDRAGAVQTVGAGLLDDPTLGFVRQLNFKSVPAHGAVDLVELQLHDFQELVVKQLIKNNDL